MRQRLCSAWETAVRIATVLDKAQEENVRLVIRMVVLSAGLTLLPGLIRAQEQPPRPVSELIVEFAADPADMSMLAMATRSDCSPAPGTWQFEYLDGVMALASRPVLDERRASFFSVLVEQCENEVLAAWLRDFLRRADGGYWVTVAASALGRSGAEPNRVAALEALFSSRYSAGTRMDIAWRWVQGQESPALGVVLLIAEAYERTSGVPPSEMHVAVSRLWNRESEALRLQGVGRLLEVVLADPEREAAIPVMASLFNLASTLPLDDPWMIDFRSVADEFATGERPSSEALFTLVMDRRRYFCRGETPVYRNGRCQAMDD